MLVAERKKKKKKNGTQGYRSGGRRLNHEANKAVSYIMGIISALYPLLHPVNRLQILQKLMVTMIASKSVI